MMRLFNFFKRQKPSSEVHRAEFLSGSPNFTPWSGDAYSNDIYRSAVDAIARNAAKLKGTYVVASGELRKPADSRINRILQVQPNPYMNAYDMLYKAVTHLFLYNNSFLFLQRGNGNITGVYPITAAQVDFLEDASGELYCKFYFADGRETILPYHDLIHLRRNFNGNELLGDANTALYPALELAHTQNEGLVSSIKNGAYIRGIIHFTQIMAPDKLREEKENFMRDYLSVSNQGGVVATDQKTEYTPITSAPSSIDESQVRAVKEKIYNYLGISEKIVNSSYNENEWAAFYESTIEPIAVQLGLEFTRKIFTEREQAYGNLIVFESSRLQFASNETKVNLIEKLMPYGLLSINQALEILNLPAVEDGDRRLQTLNVVNAEKADQYQVEDKAGGRHERNTNSGNPGRSSGRS